MKNPDPKRSMTSGQGKQPAKPVKPADPELSMREDERDAGDMPKGAIHPGPAGAEPGMAKPKATTATQTRKPAAGDTSAATGTTMKDKGKNQPPTAKR